MDIPISLLDRTRTRAGTTDAAALTQTIDRASNAEAAGYHRIWVAEHHGVPGIASGVPALMVQAIAHATERIRIGSGGVMLPNHRPIVVAQQFAMLTALHGPRIDLGVGRSLGFTKAVRQALGAETARPEDFKKDIRELRDYLHGEAAITIRPAGIEPPPLFVLGTGTGLAYAAELGLPAVVGGPALWAEPDTFQAYRDDFRPSAQQAEPYLMISADLLIADTADEARTLVLPEAWAMAASRTQGEFPPLIAPEHMPANPTRKQTEFIEQHLAGSIHGSEDEVITRLAALVQHTGADEVMTTASTFDTQALYASDARLADAWRRA